MRREDTTRKTLPIAGRKRKETVPHARLRGAEGSGAPKGNRNALKHGRYTKRAIEERRGLRRLIREAEKFLEEFET